MAASTSCQYGRVARGAGVAVLVLLAVLVVAGRPALAHVTSESAVETAVRIDGSPGDASLAAADSDGQGSSREAGTAHDGGAPGKRGKGKGKGKRRGKGKGKRKTGRRRKRARKGNAGGDVVSDDAREEAQQAFDRGNQLFTAGKVDAARELFDKARTLDPSSIGAHTNYGLCLRAQAKPDLAAAADAFLRGIDLNPGHPGTARAFNYLGVTRREQGRYQDAVQAYKNAVSRNWTLAAAHYNLGLVLYDGLGRYDEAIEAFNHALEAQPGHAGVLASSARVHRHHGHARRAVAAARKALDREPNHREAQHEYARALEAAGQLPDLLFPADQGKVTAEAARVAELYDEDEWGDEWDEDEDDEDEDDGLWQQRRGPDAMVSGDPPQEPILALAYMTEELAVERGQGFGFCRMLASAAHNRIDLEVLGRDETWTGNDGQALAAVLGRLRREPRDRVIVYVEGDLGLFVDAADDLVDKYLGFGDGNAWVFPADCNCLPFMLFDNATCSSLPRTSSPARFLHAGMWMARAGTVVDVLTDAARHAAYFSRVNAATGVGDDDFLRTPGRASSEATLRDIASAAQLFTDYFVSGLVPEMTIDYHSELFQAFTKPAYPVPDDRTDCDGTSGCATPAVVEFVGMRAHTDAKITSKCSPLDDIVDGSQVDDRLRNGRTGSSPSLLHFPRTRGHDVYNRIASWLWFHRRPPSPGAPLPGRPFGRHMELHSFGYTWWRGTDAAADPASEPSPLNNAATFADVALCPDLFRQ